MGGAEGRAGGGCRNVYKFFILFFNALFSAVLVLFYTYLFVFDLFLPKTEETLKKKLFER